MTRPQNVQLRVTLAIACIVLGVLAVALIVTGNLLWAIIPAVPAVVLAVRLQRLALGDGSQRRRR